MSTVNQKLAESLEVLRKLQDVGLAVIKSSEIGRVHRERLVKYGFLQEVLKGWYFIKPAEEQTGDTTSWNNAYWKFCARYLEDLYGTEYFISPDQSLLIHTGNYTVPKQLI
ncbi:MAG: cell filamentation protein Fic, partial [Bacteroidia bacterium]|nr:cell filamentation protein Fic [Bacteroidia bacterium]